MIEKEEILDEIRKVTKFGYSEKGSMIDNLLNRGWCRENDLLFAYDKFNKFDEGRVICFFQLPFPVKLPEYKWIDNVRSKYGNPQIAISLINSEKDNLSDLNIPQTQVFISFQL